MPRRRIAAGSRASAGVSNRTSASASTVSHAFCAISCSSWPGRPAGVAQRNEHARRALAARDGFQHVLRRREPDVVADRERRLPVAERPVQHEAAVDLDRAAEMHGRVADVGIRERNVDLLEQRRQHHVGRLVDDDAERAVLVVLADERQRVREIGIGHRRHGDQEVVREVGGGTGHGCEL